MSAAANSKAIELLEQGIVQIRQQCDNQIAELQRAIVNLKKAGTAAAPANGVTHPSSVPPVRSSPTIPRNYQGMKKATALEVYMRDHRDAGRIPLATVMRDLLAGNADLGSPDRQERNLRLTIMYKPKLYGYDERTQEVWLAATADEEAKPKPRRRTSFSGRRPNEGTRVASA